MIFVHELFHNYMTLIGQPSKTSIIINIIQNNGELLNKISEMMLFALNKVII